VEVFLLAALFVLGACVGSFLNVLIYRLPRGESIVFPGSHCPSCGRPIRWYDNIPILSWLVLRGKCRYCKRPISPQYIIIEISSAVLIAGLYACYFPLGLRKGAISLLDSWPMFTAHAALLCGLLVCSVVDAKMWIIPLEVMWVCSIVGIASATFQPHAFMPAVPAELIGISFAAVIGLVIGILLMRAGFIQPSFLDISDKMPPDDTGGSKSPGAGTANKAKGTKSVAVTAEHGVNPRKEVSRELLFLAPAIILAAAAGLMLRSVPAIGAAWGSLLSAEKHPRLAAHLHGCGSAVFGYLIGGLCVWGMRILGTLGFGKEAMGLGDVHILAAVGAVTGWIVPTVAFFVAPFFGLLWALYLWLARDQRELPYGPWLALASLVVMIFYDAFVGFLAEYTRALTMLLGQ
jgi:leader peptidase (prepilin peptidase)/N-methyltransferase